MAGITRVLITDLFWSTLGDLRETPHYSDVRRAVDDLVARKSVDRGPVNGRDKPFSSIPALRGIWHCALRRNPDIVLFYSMEGDELRLAMLGSHHDYPHQGKNFAAAQRTSTRVRNAIADGHEPSPSWETLAWRHPLDIIRNPDLDELSVGALDRLLEQLGEEAREGAMFERTSVGLEAEAAESALDEWIEALEAAHDAVVAAYRVKPLSCEAHLERSLGAPYKAG